MLRRKGWLCATLSLLLTVSVLGDWDEGLEAFRKGEYGEALERFESVVLSNPDYAPGHYMLASALYKLKRLPAAVTSFTRAVELAPDSAQYALALARAQLGAGAADPALESLRRHPIASIPDELKDAYATVLAQAASRSSEKDEAEALVRQATSSYTASKALWLALGKFREAAQDPAATFDAFSRAYDLDPHHKALGLRLVDLAFEQAESAGEDEERQRLYRSAAAVAEALTNNDSSLDTALLLGQARLLAHDYGGAESWLQELAPRAPRNARLNYYLARCAVAGGRDEEALRQLDAAVAETTDPDLLKRIYESKGYALHRSKEYAAAAEAYRLAGNDVKAALLRRAVEAQENNRRYEAKRAECLKRKARFDRLRDENPVIVGTSAWDQVEARMRRELADCEPYLETGETSPRPGAAG